MAGVKTHSSEIQDAKVSSQNACAEECARRPCYLLSILNSRCPFGVMLTVGSIGHMSAYLVTKNEDAMRP